MSPRRRKAPLGTLDGTLDPKAHGKEAGGLALPPVGCCNCCWCLLLSLMRVVAAATRGKQSPGPIRPSVGAVQGSILSQRKGAVAFRRLRGQFPWDDIVCRNHPMRDAIHPRWMPHHSERGALRCRRRPSLRRRRRLAIFNPLGRPRLRWRPSFMVGWTRGLDRIDRGAPSRSIKPPAAGFGGRNDVADGWWWADLTRAWTYVTTPDSPSIR